MRRILFEPFPTYEVSIRQITICILSGLLIFLILFVLQPLNINTLPEKSKLVYSLAYGGVTMVSLIFLTIISPLLFPKLFEQDHWIVGKEIVFIALTLLMISSMNLVAYQLLERTTIGIVDFFKFLVASFLMGLTPIGLSVFVRQRMLLKSYNKTSQSINKRLVLQKQTDISPLVMNTVDDVLPATLALRQRIILQGEGIGEKLELEVNDLWYLTSEYNYVKIVYREKEVIKTVLFRTTLAKMEQSVSVSKTMVRCHRSYLINTDNVQQSYASAQGLRLKLQQREELIPVGKTYIRKIKDLLDS